MALFCHEVGGEKPFKSSKHQRAESTEHPVQSHEPAVPALRSSPLPPRLPGPCDLEHRQASGFQAKSTRATLT